MGYKKLVLTAAVVIGFTLSTGNAMAAKGLYALGPGDVANGHKIFTQGKGDVAACLSCHGEDGSGSDALGAPRIAGQFYTFLYKQLEDFASNKRTPQGAGVVMNAFAAAMSPQDRIDVATYLASRAPTNLILFNETYLEELAASGVEVGRPYRGRQLVEFGSPVRTDGYPRDLGSQGPGVPACKSCHGVGGGGAPPVYPMIGQQRYTYLVAQLKQWRDGSRANDPMGQMQKVAQKLSDQDILDAAAYLSVADPYFATGSNRTPYDHGFHEGEERLKKAGIR